MGHSSRTTGMLQRMLSRSTPAEADAADLGTCFGLEVSLDEVAADAPVRPRQATLPEWVRRLTTRPKIVR